MIQLIDKFGNSYGEGRIKVIDKNGKVKELALPSSATWGSITGTLSSQTDLQSALDAKVDENAPITGATKTKVTYDSKGLVTGGTDATTADIIDSLNKRYVTDSDLVKLSNTSGTNTGDQTSIVGISGTKTQFDTACSDGNFLFVGDVVGITDGDKGDITVSASGTTWNIDNLSVTDAKINDVAGSKVTQDSTHRFATDAEKSTWNGKLDPNTPITGASKTKITYDTDGLVTAGADATTADIADSLNKRYVTDAQLTVIGNTSGTNSGNETTSSIGTLINAAAAATPNDTDLVATAEASVLKKITWTNVKAFFKTYFDTLYQATGNYFNKTSDDTDDITVGTTNKFATAAEKTKLGFITVTQAVDLDTIESDTATNNAKVSNATHTGDVTGSTTLTIDKTAITGKTLVTGLGTDYLLISDSSDAGNLKKCLASDLAGSGGVSDGDKGDITVSGSGTVWTIDNLAVGDAKINDVAATKVTQDATHRFVSDTDLIKLSNTSGTNSGDQTSIVGISGTKAQFDTACSDGNFLFVGDVTQYTDELAQDAVGGMAANSTFVNLAYVDGTPSLTPSLSATGTPSSTTFLRGDNTWATPATGGISDGDKGDITVSASGATWTIDNGVVSEAKMVLADNTTNDVSTTKHGFVPKAPNDSKKHLAGDGTWRNDGLFNASVGEQTISATDAYIAGSAVTIGGKIQAGTIIRFKGTVTKTAAGTATPIFNVRFGTNGTTADTARHTFTGVAQTAAIDTGFFEITVVVRSVSATATSHGGLRFEHFNTTTGLANKAQVQLIQNTSAAYDNTSASLIVGLSINNGASASWVVQQITTEILNLI